MSKLNEKKESGLLENLQLAYENARIGKSGKKYVIDFEKDLKKNLSKLNTELVSLSV